MNHAPTPSNRFALTATRIFDGEKVLTGHAVLVEEGIVRSVVPIGSLPGDVQEVYDEPDSTITPGLIDTHTHFMRWEGPLFLACGVTTIRDTGNDLKWILERRSEGAAHPWPRILCMGPLLDGPTATHPVVSRACADLEDAVGAVRETVAAGVDGVKLYVGLETEWLPAMVREARCGGVKTSMHCQRGGVLAAGRAGVEEFFHLDGILADVWPERPAGWLNLWGLPEFSATLERQRRVADDIRRLGMTATPTLAYWESQWRVRTPGFLESEALSFVPRALIESQPGFSHDASDAAQWRRALDAAQAFTGLLLERGVPILAGSDVPCGPVPPGLSLWRELALLQEAGMTPEQALRAATSEAATFLGRPDLGRLRSGSAADLVVLKGNPLERIPERPDVVRVVRNGTVFHPSDLLEESQRRAPILKDDPWGIQFARHSERRSPLTPDVVNGRRAVHAGRVRHVSPSVASSDLSQ